MESRIYGIKAKCKLEEGPKSLWLQLSDSQTNHKPIPRTTSRAIKTHQMNSPKFIMNLNEYNLTSSPNMVGLNEAWIIDKTIYVSPAIYQLLTDQDDSHTKEYVASHLSVRTATYKELNELSEKKS